MKKFVLLFLCCVIILSYTPTALAEDTIENYYLPPVSLGYPFVNAQPLNTVVFEMDGKDYMCTSSLGNSSIFNVYCVDDRKYVFSYQLNLQRQIWKHVVGLDNTVYALGNGITAYNPYENSMKKALDFSMFGEVLSYTGCVDSNNILYAGTYPSGKIIRYDPATGEARDMGAPDPDAFYLRSIEHINGFLYATVVGEKANCTAIYKLNPSDCSIVAVFEVPNTDYYDISQIKTMYSVSTAGDLLVYWCQMESGYMMLVFDTQTEAFIDIGFRGSYSGLYASPPHENKVYFISSSKLFGIDLTTKRVFETNIPVQNFSSFYGVGWATIENNPEFPGKSLATFSNQNGHPNFINVQTGKQIQYEDPGFVKTRVKLNSIESNPAGTLHIGGYQGDRALIYDIKTHEFKEFRTGQVEGSVAYKGKHYYGIYTGAWFVRYDPDVHVKSGDRLEHITQVGEKQDRPYVLKAADDKIFLGTLPDYMQLGGALAWYDLNTQKMTTIRNVVQDQSVYGLAYKDGIIYGSTYIAGGLGSIPTATRAKMFVYDVENNAKIKEFEPQIPGFDNPKLIGEIAFDSDGKLWAVADYTLFSVDPETETVLDVLNFGVEPDSAYRSVTYLRFDDKGYLYVDINGLKVVNTRDMTYKDLTPLIGTSGKAGLYTIGPDGNLYFRTDQDTATDNLRMIPISDFPITAQDLTDVRDFLRDKITLNLDSPYANVEGAPQIIDVINENFLPIVEDGKTLAPIRFISEAFGASVNWECETSTVTITKDQLNAVIQIGKREISVNGNPMTLDYPAAMRSGRVMLPLRAIAMLFNKEIIFDDESGAILIADNKTEIDGRMSSLIDVYFKYYIREDYKANEDAANKRAYKEEAIRNLNGREIEIPNKSFEQTPGYDNPVPDFTLMNPIGQNCSGQISKDKAFDGTQSLKIIDTSANALTGYQSDYISIDPAKNHKLYLAVYLEIIRTDYAIEIYNESKQLIDKIVVGGSLTMTPGEWNLMETDIGANLYPEAKYIRIQLYTPLAFTSQCYYDGLSLIEY